MSQKFISDELVSIHTTAYQIINSHLTLLDKTSNDIRVLEATLKKAAVPFEFVYILFIDKIPRYTIHYGCIYDGVMSEVDEYNEHCLVWSQTEEGARLRYNVNIIRKEYDPDGKQPYYSTKWLESSIPLIEAKAITRLRVEKDLPFFYKSIIEKLEQNKKDTCCYYWSPFYVENSAEGALSLTEEFEFALGIQPKPLGIQSKPWLNGLIQHK